MVSFGWPLWRISVVVTHLPSKQVSPVRIRHTPPSHLGPCPTRVTEKGFPVGREQTSNPETFGQFGKQVSAFLSLRTGLRYIPSTVGVTP